MGRGWKTRDGGWGEVMGMGGEMGRGGVGVEMGRRWVEIRGAGYRKSSDGGGGDGKKMRGGGMGKR